MGTVVSRCHISKPCQHKPYIPKVENTSSTSQNSGEVLEGCKQSVPCLLATSRCSSGVQEAFVYPSLLAGNQMEHLLGAPCGFIPLVLEGAEWPPTCLPLPPRLAGPRRSCQGLCCSGPPRRE